jgi:hypothetical protein
MMAVCVYVAQLFCLPLHAVTVDTLQGSADSAPLAIHQEHKASELIAYEALKEAVDKAIAPDSSDDAAAPAISRNTLALPPTASLASASIPQELPRTRPPGSAWSRGPPAIA